LGAKLGVTVVYAKNRKKATVHQRNFQEGGQKVELLLARMTGRQGDGMKKVQGGNPAKGRRMIMSLEPVKSVKQGTANVEDVRPVSPPD